MMTDLSGNGSVKFYIDGIEFLNLWWNGWIYEDNYDVYTTPLLPAWTYELKWRVDKVKNKAKNVISELIGIHFAS